MTPNPSSFIFWHTAEPVALQPLASGLFTLTVISLYVPYMGII